MFEYNMSVWTIGIETIHGMDQALQEPETPAVDAIVSTRIEMEVLTVPSELYQRKGGRKMALDFGRRFFPHYSQQMKAHIVIFIWM